MFSLRFFCLFFAMGFAFSAAAQNPVVTVDLDRLINETQIGRYLSFQMNEEAKSLQAEMNVIEADLSAEEDELIKKRETLDIEDFRVLAKAFDEKAVRLRQEQQAKIQAITEESSRRRQDLLRSFVPVLSQVMRNRGATVLLDRRSVVLDDRASVDITDVAIMIIDQNTTETDAATDLETPADPSVQE
jgi:Skp family chaperone for outer membrane proteins